MKQPGSGGTILCALTGTGPRLTGLPGVPSANAGNDRMTIKPNTAMNLSQNGIVFASKASLSTAGFWSRKPEANS
jgi:hypothetical protein